MSDPAEQIQAAYADWLESEDGQSTVASIQGSHHYGKKSAQGLAFIIFSAGAIAGHERGTQATLKAISGE